MLPPDFKWLRKEVGMVYGDTRWLYVGSRVVAMVGRTIDGQWYTTVNRHQEVQHWRDANCARLEQGCDGLNDGPWHKPTTCGLQTPRSKVGKSHPVKRPFLISPCTLQAHGLRTHPKAFKQMGF